jgi:chromosome segregation ATPase
MLQVKSFEIMNSDGISEFLKTHRLAEGMGIIVSNGVVCVPFDDGEPMNVEQKRLEIKEAMNKLERQVEPMDHSQLVLEDLLAELNRQNDKVVADLKDSPTNGSLKGMSKELKQAIEQNQSQQRHNTFEITRIRKNIERYQSQLDALN